MSAGQPAPTIHRAEKKRYPVLLRETRDFAANDGADLAVADARHDESDCQSQPTRRRREKRHLSMTPYDEPFYAKLLERQRNRRPQRPEPAHESAFTRERGLSSEDHLPPRISFFNVSAIAMRLAVSIKNLRDAAQGNVERLQRTPPLALASFFSFAAQARRSTADMWSM